MADLVTAYDTAPGLYEEEQELVRTMAQLPLRERLLRRAALADRGTLDVPEADGKAQQSIRSAALKLAAHDQAHGTAVRPPGVRRVELPRRAATGRLARDPGATPCEDEATARAYAEGRYREDEDPDDPAVLRWDEDGELMDHSIPGSYQGAGWTVAKTPVIRPADLPE